MPLDVTQSPANDPDHDPFAKFNTPASSILFPVGERKVGWQRRDEGFEVTDGHKAIIRIGKDGKPKLLNIVGSSYQLVHNRELFTHVEQTMRDQMLPDQLHDVRVTDKVSGWGRVCYRDYVFPSIKCRLPGTRSDIAFRLIVQNGYGGSALRMHVGAIDFYCTNGMIRGDYTATYRRHTKNMGLTIDSLDTIIEKALLSFASSEQLWSAWAQKPVRHVQAMQLFHDLARSPRMQEKLAAQYLREAEHRGENLWAVYSTLTYYASHNDNDFGLRKTVHEQDTVASTMLQRELDVAKWTTSEKWKELEQA